MNIQFDRFRFPQTVLSSLGARFTAHLVEETLPGGSVEYVVLEDEPAMRPNNVQYWTNTAGATSSRCYLGLVEIEITAIPDWATTTDRPRGYLHPTEGWVSGGWPE